MNTKIAHLAVKRDIAYVGTNNADMHIVAYTTEDDQLPRPALSGPLLIEL